MSRPTSGSESLHVSENNRPEGIREMNDLFLLEPELKYHTSRTRDELKPVRYRKWRRRLEWHGPDAATDEKNWIN
jgi:hypothetical protein